MTTVQRPQDGASTLVMPCRSCGKPVYFGFTPKGKRCPFDVVDGEPTTVSHFETCPQASSWSRR